MQASLRELLVSDSQGTPSGQRAKGATDLSQKQIEEVQVVFSVSLRHAYFFWWQLLQQAEDDGDAKAASQAKAEQVAELAEFDENFSVQQSKDTKVHTYGP